MSSRSILFSSLCLMAVGCTQWNHQLAGVMPHLGQHYEQELSSARLVEQSGQMLQARQRYEQLVERYPRQSEPYQRLGILCQLQGENARALQLLEQAHRIAPEDADILNDLGYSLYMQGEHKRAVSALQLAQEVNPADSRVGANLAMALAVSGDTNSAYTLLRSSRGESGAASGIGFAMAQAGQPDVAQHYFSKALSADPDNRAAAEGMIQLAQAGYHVGMVPPGAMIAANVPGRPDELMRGSGFVVAPQQQTGYGFTVPVSTSQSEALPQAADVNIRSSETSVAASASRVSLEAIVNTPEPTLTPPPAKAARVATIGNPLFDEVTLSAHQSSLDGFTARTASTAFGAATSRVLMPVDQEEPGLNPGVLASRPLPPLAQDSLAINAASRGIVEPEAPIIVASLVNLPTETPLPQEPQRSSAPPMPPQLGSGSRQVELLESTLEATVSRDAEPRAASVETEVAISPPETRRYRESHDLINTTFPSTQDALWQPAARINDWVAADERTTFVEMVGFGSVEAKRSPPSLLPQQTLTASSYAPVNTREREGAAIDTPDDLDRVEPESIKQSVVEIPHRLPTEQSSPSTEMWKTHLIADYGQLPLHKRLDLWKHSGLTAEKALCLFPLTEGIERVEASLALARLLGWHDFARVSLTQLGNSENSVVRNYAQQALTQRLAPVADNASDSLPLPR